MKITIFLTAFILFNMYFSVAQNDEESIKKIREQFKTINDEIKTYTSELHDIENNATGIDQTVTTYFKGKQLMKIEEEFLGDMAESSNQYYFWNNQLFFVFTTSTYHAYIEGTEETTTNENRYYFSNNKLIRWLDCEKKQRDKNDKEFIEKEKAWIYQAEEYQIKYKK